MSRHSEEYVRIPGVHYRCKLRFGTTQGLDQLADFFLNQVLPSEQRLSVLFNSFGLPQRIIEDVLAELLKRNCATLDVLHGQIKPVADGIPGKIYDPENDRSLEIWQDDIAGGFLPFDQIENRSGAADSSRITFLRRDADTPFLPLLNASDSRIVTALGRGRSCLRQTTRRSRICIPDRQMQSHGRGHLPAGKEFAVRWSRWTRSFRVRGRPSSAVVVDACLDRRFAPRAGKSSSQGNRVGACAKQKRSRTCFAL